MNRPENGDGLAEFSTMLREALSDLLDPGAATFLEMLSDDAVLEFPYTPPGAPRLLEGRVAVAEYVSKLGNFVTIESMSVPIVHRTTRAGVVILEFEGVAVGIRSGKSHNQTYISVITLRDGHIIHYRDYWNPLVTLEATRDVEAPIEASEVHAGISLGEAS